MITGELKSQIDKVWEAFWTGGLSNPLTVIEQMTYLLFIRRLDELQTKLQYLSLNKDSARTGEEAGKLLAVVQYTDREKKGVRFNRDQQFDYGSSSRDWRGRSQSKDRDDRRRSDTPPRFGEYKQDRKQFRPKDKACYYCGKLGHIQRECRKKRSAERAQNGWNGQPSETNNSFRQQRTNWDRKWEPSQNGPPGWSNQQGQNRKNQN